MTGRELIELAARAAGLAGNYYNGDRTMAAHFATLDNEGRIIKWNPLTEDGDALRLAVRLGILLRTDFIKRLTVLFCAGIGHAEATRQAITEIAAEIGRNMP
jgi:hypothetical protein